MRSMMLLALVVVGSACSDDDSQPVDAASDGASDAEVDANMRDGCVLACGGDAAPVCGPTGACPSGPACSATCCGAGEECVGGVCRCGAGAACGVGDTCEAAGPSGGDRCGIVCCGISGPCPQ